MPPHIDLAIVGGSGFYDMPGLDGAEDIEIPTPFGPPSDAIRVGSLEGRQVAFVARHGRRHTLLPSELPQRANIWALKSLGVTQVLGISAVGSLREDFHPGDLVLPDQLVDRTRGSRPQTFFGDGVVAHIAFADPFCPRLRQLAVSAARRTGATAHAEGTYVTIEGPAFGTRAESELYRSWGIHVVGMTALPEAKLAREAEVCYATVAAVTDYDAWHSVHEAVDAAAVFAVLKHNVETGREVVRRLVRALPGEGTCGCGTALDAALVTPSSAIDEGALARLGPILRRRLGVAAA
jgi:5'-methylthioadenosine phosphorylase